MKPGSLSRYLQCPVPCWQLPRQGRPSPSQHVPVTHLYGSDESPAVFATLKAQEKLKCFRIGLVTSHTSQDVKTLEPHQVAQVIPSGNTTRSPASTLDQVFSFHSCRCTLVALQLLQSPVGVTVTSPRSHPSRKLCKRSSVLPRHRRSLCQSVASQTSTPRSPRCPKRRF